MNYKQSKGNEIEGILDVFVSRDEVEENGELVKRDEILIHGNPAGLKSFAKLLLELAELNQEEMPNTYLPSGARAHYQLRPGMELSASSDLVIVGRIDAKGTGAFYQRYIPK